MIISAGFDAHLKDPLAGCTLVDKDFEWATEMVVEVRVGDAIFPFTYLLK